MTENPYNYRQRSIGLGHKRFTNITQCTSPDESYSGYELLKLTDLPPRVKGVLKES